MPVYNGEKHLRKALDCLLNQTITNFEIIISDNASTDSTSEICQEYTNKDNRIKYIRQEQNKDILFNFNFVLQQAKHKYFMWAAADDLWLPKFLEKNTEVLESNKNMVGSISKIAYLDKQGKLINNKNPDEYKKNPEGKSFEDRVKFFLRIKSSENIYAVFRTSALQKAKVKKLMLACDRAILLNVLKYGDIHVIDEVLFHRSAYGQSGRTTVIERSRFYNEYGILGSIFPFFPFTYWSIRNLGTKIFLKNLDWFILKNISFGWHLAFHLSKKYNLKGLEKFLLKFK